MTHWIACGGGGGANSTTQNSLNGGNICVLWIVKWLGNKPHDLIIRDGDMESTIRDKPTIYDRGRQPCSSVVPK
jgi:hypothetical protein